MCIYKLVLIVCIACAISACDKEQNKEVHNHTIAEGKYTCPMHPSVIQDKPGKCPICGMDLVPIKSNKMVDAIMLTESQIKLGNITTMLTRYEDMGSTMLLSGKLMVNEDQTEVISSRVEGRIEKLYVKEAGLQIKQGAPLYEIYSEQLLTLQQEYLLALKQYEQLGQTEKRFESFLHAAEKKLLLFGLTKNQIIQLSKTRVAGSKTTFVSPVSGVVANIEVAEGQYIKEGNVLYRVDKLDNLWVEAELYQNEYSLVKMGDSVKIIVSGFEQIPLKGKIIFLSPEYNQGSQIITLRAIVSNRDKIFLPGMQANVNMLNTEKKVIALPVDAVIRDASGEYVWVLNDDGSYKLRTVNTGIENSDRVEIINGLELKENVVVTGAYLLYGELVLKKGGGSLAKHNIH